MARSTARDLVEASLSTIGAIGESDPMTASMQNKALDELNTMIESWNTDDLIPYVQTEKILTLVSGTSTYTISPTGDIVDTIPNDVSQVNLIIDSTEFPLTKMNQFSFNQIGKNDSTGTPCEFVYRLGATQGELEFYPTPNGNTARVVYNKLLGELSINDTLALPNGYYGAFQYGLAETLLPHYGVSGDANAQDIKIKAKEMKARLMKQNFKSRLLKGNRVGKYDIMTNQYRYY